MKKSLFFYCAMIATATITAIYSYDDMEKIWHHHQEPTPRTNSSEDVIKDIRYLYNRRAIDYDEETGSFELFITDLNARA